MKTPFKPPAPAGNLPAASWPAGAALTLASCMLLCSGCQTASPWANALKKQPATASNSGSSKGTLASKNDFHKEVTPDQQFNMHVEFGRVLEAEKQYDAALAEYEKALEACNRGGFGFGVKGSGAKQALAHRRMGGALDRMGRFAQAESHYQLALKANPDDANVWNDSGYSLYMQSRWVDAERNLKTAARLAPDNIRIQTNLGLVLAAQGKTDEALSALGKAGGEAIAHANLGYLLAASGQKEQAREQYQTALRLQPNLGAARQALTALDNAATRPAQATAGLASATPPAPSTVTADLGVLRVSTPKPQASPSVPPTVSQPDAAPQAPAIALAVEAPKPAPALAMTTPPAPALTPPSAPALTPPSAPALTPPSATRAASTRTMQTPRLSAPPSIPRYMLPPSDAVPVSSRTKPATTATSVVTTSPASGPRAKPLALTPKIDAGTQSSTPSTGVGTQVVRTRKPVAPYSTPAPKTALQSGYGSTTKTVASAYATASKPVVTTTKPTGFDPGVARVSLPPVYDPRKPPVSGIKASASRSLPPGFDPKRPPISKPDASDPHPGRVTLPPTASARMSLSSPAIDDGGRPALSVKPPVSDPRLLPVAPSATDTSDAASPYSPWKAQNDTASSDGSASSTSISLLK